MFNFNLVISRPYSWEVLFERDIEYIRLFLIIKLESQQHYLIIRNRNIISDIYFKPLKTLTNMSVKFYI